MNPGDRVQVHRPGYLIHGWVGELEFIADAGTAYVKIDGQLWPIHPADLQPVEDPE